MEAPEVHRAARADRAFHRWRSRRAREAGAVVGGLRGRPESEALVVAAAPGVHGALHDLLVELDADHDPLADES